MTRYHSYNRETVADTVRIALTPVKPLQEYVSHKSLGRAIGEGESNKAAFNSQNHAIYLGKIISPAKEGKIRKAFGLGGDEKSAGAYNIYSEELITACLDYAFAHAEKGAKIKVYVARIFSEMINGKKDAGLAMPVNEEMEFIYRIVEKMGKKRAELDVENLEFSDRHGEIFAALKEAYDEERGCADTKKVLDPGNGEIQLDKQSSSLDIARLLYAALRKNKSLRDRLKVTIPGALEENIPDEQLIHLSCYAVCEIAIRVREIMLDSYIHEGVDRQVVYDDLINELITNDKTARKNYPELEPLFRLLKGKKFETVHISNDPEKNHFFSLAERVRARTRMMTYGILFAAGLAGAVGGGAGIAAGWRYVRDNNRAAAVEAEIRENVSCTDDFGGLREGAACVERFRLLVSRIIENIRTRYNITEERMPEIKAMVEDFLMEKNHYNFAAGEPDTDLIADMVIKDNLLYLKSAGRDMGITKMFDHDTVRRLDGLDLMPVRADLSMAAEHAGRDFKLSEAEAGSFKKYRYKDTLGEFDFEIILYPSGKQTYSPWDDYRILARNPIETEFSVQRGREASRYFNRYSYLRK